MNHRQQAAWVIGVLALASMACVAWLIWPAPSPAPHRPAGAAVDSSRLAEGLTTPAPTLPASAAVAALDARSLRPPVAAVRSPGATEVCGLGTLSSSATEAEVEKLRAAFESVEAQQAVERLIDRLAARSDLHQVAALALRAGLQAERDMNQEMPNCAKDDQACADIVRRWHLRRELSYAGFAAQALPLAMRSRDPAAFALVSQMCEAAGREAPHDCSATLLQAWAAQQPDNAAPWLMLAGQERQRGHLQAAEEALYRASLGRSLNNQLGSVQGLMGASEFGADGGLAAVQLQNRWMAVISGLGLSAAVPASRSCDAQALRDANQRKRCEALAELMVSQSPDLLSRVIGRRMAQNLGWPAVRLKALDDQALALQQMQTRLVMAEAEPMACAALQRQQQRARAMAAQGEVAYLDAQMKAQGLSHQQLADELRAQLAQAQQRAQTAPAVPSR